MPRHDVSASIAGVVARLEVAEGAIVGEGETIMILESMKMEIPVEAPVRGRVLQLHVQPDAQVDEGELLATLET